MSDTITTPIVKLRHAELPQEFCLELQRDFVTTFNAQQCAQYGRDESCYPPMPPQAVVFAHSTEELAAIVKLCARYQVPMIAWGSGTSLEGHVLALHGGVCIDLSKMQRILAVHVEDMTVTLEAGVTRKQLNAWLHDSGLFFPVDPGADASLGGMAATRASGTNAVRYGTMRENTLAMKVVLADGSIVNCGTRARKSSAGYDLTRLFVGSEGTLGIIAELSVRLHPQPSAQAVAVCAFPHTKNAVQCVIEAIQAGISMARVEFLDQHCAQALNRSAGLQLPQQALLMFEFHGSQAGVEEQAQQIQALANEHAATSVEWASQTEQRTRLWAARHHAYFALLQMRPGARAITTDCCVPISHLAEIILATEADCQEYGMTHSIIGHVGDGNFHLLLLIDADNPQEWQRAEAINAAMVTRALACDGTCSGEHGVGLHKIQFMQQEHGDVAVQLMQTLKHALDPQNLMNPGKMLPPAAGI